MKKNDISFALDSKKTFICNVDEDNLNPSHKHFDHLRTIKQINPSIYLTVNINFKENTIDNRVDRLFDEFDKHNNGNLRLQPKDELHCSLLNLVTFCGKKNTAYFNANNFFKNKKKDLNKYLKDLLCCKFEYFCDFIFVSKETIALQVFISHGLVKILEEAKNGLNRLLTKGCSNVLWENKIKLYPSEPLWGVMNLIRFNKKKLSIDQSKYLAEFICEFNEEAKKRDNSFYTSFAMKPVLVISDPLFSKEGGSKVLSFC